MQKMLSNLSEKFGEKFPSTATKKIPRLDDIFSEILELEASPGEGKQLQPKDKKRRKIKGEKNTLRRRSLF